MNVKDDVMPSKAIPRALRVAAPILGALAALAAAALVPPAVLPLFETRLAWSPREAPPAAPEGVAISREGDRLVMRSGQARRLDAMAAPLVARERNAERELFDATTAATESWRAAAVPGPHTEPSPVVALPALLRAEAEVRRELVRRLPPAYSAATRVPATGATVEVLALTDAVRRAAESSDLPATRAALESLVQAEMAWLASGVPSRDAATAERGAVFRRLQLERADAFERIAQSLEVTLTPEELQQVPGVAAEWLAPRGAGVAPVLAALAQGGPRQVPADVQPLPRAWALWLAAAALAGALAGALPVALMRPRRGSRAGFAPERTPAEAGVWLHVVTGPSTRAIARGVLEVAAHGLARRERVLVVDGGPRLALHEVFEREPRWGLMECLTADMPVLGLVQYGGRPGLYLLAHGKSARGEGWSRLGQCLDDIRPHFGRVVLALEPGAPREAGDSMVGRALEAWWAEPVRKLPRVAVDWVARMGIALSGMDLSAIPEAKLEVLRERTNRLEPAPLEGAWARVVEASTPPPSLEGLPAPEALVLDCDLQVRERLRFLAWMRRVQKESRRRAEVQAVPQG